MKQKQFRPLADIISDFEEKVIEFAQIVQAMLAHKIERTFVASAAQRVGTCVSTGEPPASVDFPLDRARTSNEILPGDPSFLADLRSRQRKRRAPSEPAEQPKKK